MSSEIIITRKFKLTNLTGESIPNMYGFSNTSTDKFMYTFGGNKVCDYSDNLKNLNVFHNPTLDRHKLLPHSSTMFEINVIDAEIKSVNAAPEYRNANGTMHIISKDGDGSANKIILLGGYNRQLVL